MRRCATRQTRQRIVPPGVQAAQTVAPLADGLASPQATTPSHCQPVDAPCATARLPPQPPDAVARCPTALYLVCPLSNVQAIPANDQTTWPYPGAAWQLFRVGPWQRFPPASGCAITTRLKHSAVWTWAAFPDRTLRRSSLAAHRPAKTLHTPHCFAPAAPSSVPQGQTPTPPATAF